MEMKPHPEALLLLGQQSAQKLRFSQANEMFLFLPLKSGKILRVTFSSFAHFTCCQRLSCQQNRHFCWATSLSIHTGNFLHFFA